MANRRPNGKGKAMENSAQSSKQLTLPTSLLSQEKLASRNELMLPDLKRRGFSGRDEVKSLQKENCLVMNQLRLEDAVDAQDKTVLSDYCNRIKESPLPTQLLNVSNSFKGDSMRTEPTANKTRISKEEGRAVKTKQWTRAKAELVWNKLKTVKNKVKRKKDHDYEVIKSKILQNREEEVYNILADPEFLKFYRSKDSLFPPDVFMDIMINNKKLPLLLQVVKCAHYKFDTDYIFKYIYSLLQPNTQLFSSTDKDSTHHMEVMSSKQFSRYSNTESKLLLLNCYIKNKTSIIDGLIDNNLYNFKDEKRTKIIGWLLGFLNYYDTFLQLIRKSKVYQGDMEKYNNFSSIYYIKHYCDSPSVITMVIDYCLKCNFESLAVLLLELTKAEVDNNALVTCAAELERMEFLKYLWEKDYANENIAEMIGLNLNDNAEGQKCNPQQQPSSLIAAPLNSAFAPYKAKVSFEKIVKILTKSTSIDKRLRDKYSHLSSANISKVLDWKGIENDPSFISVLFDNDCFEQISSLIYKWPSEKFSDSNYFKKAIENDQTELIFFFLSERKECKSILNEEKIQSTIVERYTKSGDKLYYGAEMLLNIHKNHWSTDLTKNLCKNIIKTIKSKEIANCHSIILTCLLLCEFLTQIKEISIANVSRCEKVMSELKDYCKNLQESNPQESYINYLMKQKDTKDRSAFQIASDNNIYCLLETAEIGTIVKKMWDGKLSTNGFLAASSLHRYLTADRKATEPFSSFDNFDTNKVYFFQYCVWTDSCSLRYKPEGLGTIVLIVIYNVLIYLLALKNQMLNNFFELEPALRILLIIYIGWVTTLLCGMLIRIIFLVKTQRKFKLDVWNYMDILLFTFAWMILLDTRHMQFSSYHNDLTQVLRNVLWDLEIPFTKELKTEISYFSGSFAFLLKTFILTVNDILVWLRITGILLTYKEMGPVIRMILSMALLLVKYLSVIGLFVVLSGSIFQVIFSRYSPLFSNYWTTLLTLFGGFFNNFDLNNFDSDYEVLGSLMLMVYVCIAGVLLVNLLIAVLSNVYDELSKVVDASHRAVLIQYYRKSKWDEHYGYLIFLSPPLSIVNFLTLLVSFFIPKNSRAKFNVVISKAYYFLFYYPVILLCYMTYTIILIPFCYIKGIILMIKYQFGLKILAVYKLLHVLKWIVCGLFYLLFVCFRDILFSLRNVFNDFEAKDSDLQRIAKNLSEHDVIVFLKFIHSKKLGAQGGQAERTIHSFFLAYLDFEANEASKADDELKKKSDDYMKKLDMSSVQLKHNPIPFYKAKAFFLNKENEASKLYTNYIRKNLMIIEILENFLIEDKHGVMVVDIDKMRKLLPMSMNIKKPYLRRLMHSSSQAINQSMTKAKVEKNLFLQYQLINKIMSSAQKLDKDIDAEIIRTQRTRLNERKLQEKAISSIIEKDTNSNAKSYIQKKQELALMRKYNRIIRNVLSDITDTINFKYDHQSSISEKDSNTAKSSSQRSAASIKSDKAQAYLP